MGGLMPDNWNTEKPDSGIKIFHRHPRRELRVETPIAAAAVGRRLEVGYDEWPYRYQMDCIMR